MSMWSQSHHTSAIIGAGINNCMHRDYRAFGYAWIRNNDEQFHIITQFSVYNQARYNIAVKFLPDGGL